MIFTDLRELAAVLDLDPNNPLENKKLLFFSEWVTGLINEYLGHGLYGIDYRTRVQYYNGTGTQKLILRSRPVYPSPPSPYSPISVVIDTGGYYGSASGAFQTGSSGNQPLVYGTDYCMIIDQIDGSSRSAVLIRINDYWPKPQIRQTGLLSPFISSFDTGSIQVTYTAGWTLDTLPAVFRMCAAMLVAAIRRFLPYSTWLTSESYEERAVSYYIMQFWDLMDQLIRPYRNWKW